MLFSTYLSVLIMSASALAKEYWGTITKFQPSDDRCKDEISRTDATISFNLDTYFGTCQKYDMSYKDKKSNVGK